jgi:hypothetical protein
MATRSKAAEATRRQAREQLKAGQDIEEIAHTSGLSRQSITQMKGILDGTRKMPGKQGTGTPTPIRKEKSAAPPKAQGSAMLDFAESPSPIGEPKNMLDSAFDSLKGMLGISEKERGAKAPAPLVSAKLNSKQQQFVDACAPTLALATMSIAAWAWGHLGAEYGLLAPDEGVATRIVTPLLRIYARHATFLMDINPDMADLGASLFAIVGYVHVSLGIYQEIKREQEEGPYEEQASSQPRGRTRTYRAERATPAPESGTRREGDRSRRVPERNHGTDDSEHGGDARDTGSLSGVDPTSKEARQYEALRRLSQLDYEHRARRSSRAG